jgi:hypothetical protein
MTKLAAPVFVGGTGRSGTTVLAELLGQHSAFAVIPIEARFQAEARGLPGVHEGRVSVDAFRERFLKRYYFRRRDDGAERGLRLAGIPRGRAVRAIDEFVENYAADPRSASATFMNRLFNPLARAADARTWVEMTPPNVEFASFLQTLFPQARILHIVRDGRDVAASVSFRRWGPDDPFEALEWWADRLRAADAATGDRRRVLLVGFEALVFNDRNRQYRRILRFLGLSDEPAMRDFFEQSLTPEHANRGRWREIVPPEQHDAFEHAYDQIVRKLASEGVAAVKVLDHEATGRRRLLDRLKVPQGA